MTEPPKRAPNAVVTIVLPAKNEGATIGRTLRSLPRATLTALGLESEVFVLDGNSTDDTARIARDWGATVVQDREPGKGAALRHARHLFRGDYVVMLDADGTYATDAIPRVLDPLLSDEADIVMGGRRPLRGSMRGHHVVGNALLSALASVLYGRACPDLCTGLWGFRRDVLHDLPLRSRRFGLEAELFALSARLGHRLSYVQVDYLPRSGAAKLNFGSDGLRIVRRLMRSRFVPLPSPARGRRRPVPAEAAKREVQA